MCMYIHTSVGYMGTGVGICPHKCELHGQGVGVHLHGCGCTWARVWVYIGMDEGIYGYRHVCLLVFRLLIVLVMNGMKTFSETITLKIDLVNLVFGKTNVLK